MQRREEPITIPLAQGLSLTGTVEIGPAGRQHLVTIEGDPMRSNRLLERLHDSTREEPNCWDGFAPEVDLLVGDDPDSVVLYFVESRRAWVTERLDALIREDPTARAVALWLGGDPVSGVALYCEERGVTVQVALRELAKLTPRF